MFALFHVELCFQEPARMQVVVGLIGLTMNTVIFAVFI